VRNGKRYHAATAHAVEPAAGGQHFDTDRATRIVRRTGVMGPDGGPLDGELAPRIRSATGGRVMERPLRTSMEAAFGVGLDDVRIR